MLLQSRILCMVNTKIQAWKTRLTHESDDEQFAQKQEEICHFVQDSHPKGLKRIIYSLQKRGTDKRITGKKKKRNLKLHLCKIPHRLTWSCSSWGGRRHLWQRCKSFCHKLPPRGQTHHSNQMIQHYKFTVCILITCWGQWKNQIHHIP